jgi:hypothetical protein
MTGSRRLAAMLNGKMTPNSGDSRKNRPGRKPEHFQAQTHALAAIAQKELDARLGLTAPEPASDIPFAPKMRHLHHKIRIWGK